MASSKRSLADLPKGPVIDAEWTPIEEAPLQPRLDSQRPIVVKLRRRAVAPDRTTARATERGRRCLVCGDAITIAPLKVGPFKAPLCIAHATTAHVAALMLRKIIG